MYSVVSFGIFDTRFDTKKFSVTKEHFYLRTEYGVKGKHHIYLSITGGGKRLRIKTDIWCLPKDWDELSQKIKGKENYHENLKIESIKSAITEIKTQYYINKEPLTPEILVKAYKGKFIRFKLIPFMEHFLEEESAKLAKGTVRRTKSVIEKIKSFDEDVTFMNVTPTWVDSFINFYSKNNKTTTINSNLSVLRKYINMAHRYNIRTGMHNQKIKVGSTLGNRTFLNVNELEKTVAYFYGDAIKPHHKIILGYFIFSCYTGMRFGDVMNLCNGSVQKNEIVFISKKTDKTQVIQLNERVKELLKHCPLLFTKRLTNEYVNRELKLIFAKIGLEKDISFHLSRHTFATLLIKNGSKIENVQSLLGHSKITDTMIYAKILQEEANKDVFLLDNLF